MPSLKSTDPESDEGAGNILLSTIAETTPIASKGWSIITDVYVAWRMA